MFNTPVTKYLHNLISDSLSVRISAARYKNDNAANLLSTILLAERFPNHYPDIKRITAVERAARSYYEFNNLDNARIKDRCSFHEMYQVKVYEIRDGNPEDIEPILDILREEYKKGCNGNRAIELEDVEQYLWSMKKIKSVVIHVKEYCSTIVITGRLSYSRWHCILSAFPRMLPALFEDEPLTEDEKELLRSLTENDDRHFIRCVSGWESKANFREKFILKKLTKFSDGRIERIRTQLRSQIDDLNRMISDYERSISDRVLIREQKTRELLGLETADEETDKALIDYFLVSKELNLIDAEDGRIIFEVCAPLSNYDLDLYDTYVENTKSCFYSGDNYYGTPEESGRRLLKAIFDTGEIKVMMRGVFSLNFEAYRISIKDEGYYTTFANNALDNPHLKAFRCLGNNEQYLYDAVRKSDYVLALTYCISIVGNLNFGEPYNVANFMHYLFGFNRKCLKIDGSEDMLTVDQAIKYLADKDREEEKSKE